MFNRRYQLQITINNQIITISDPIQIQFSGNKSIFSGLNKINIAVYNLKRANYLRIRKDREEFTRIPITLNAGYEDSPELQVIFKGHIHTANAEKQGTNIITKIECIDGIVAYRNTFVNITSTNQPVRQLANALQDVEVGNVAEKNLIRPKVLIGNALDLIYKQLDPDETAFIDNGRFNTLKANEIFRGNTIVVQQDRNLLGVPTRKNRKVTFTTYITPRIQLGKVVQLVSRIAPHLNGLYKVENINFSGDTRGKDWYMTITGSIATGFVEV